MWTWKVKVKSLSRVRLFATPWAVAYYRILQARVLEWVAISFSRGSSQPRDRTEVSHISGRRFNLWATREVQYFDHLIWRTDLLGKTLIWERSKAGGEGDDRGWDGWMASLTWWIWVWVNYRSWWWTGRPGVLQSMGLQRVGHDWATELNWTDTYTPSLVSLHPAPLGWLSQSPGLRFLCYTAASH